MVQCYYNVGDFMNRVILIKYGELTTKKANRNFFIKTLYQNIRNKLKNYPVQIYSDLSRMSIEFEDKDLDSILKRMNSIFGIHEYMVAVKVEKEDEVIKKSVLDILKEKEFSTFKVETKRSDKTFPISSLDYSRIMGGVILKNIPNVKVDVHHPDVLLQIEIRRDCVYLYTIPHMGIGGYPSGTLGRGMLMLSGGIDSPVAGYLAMKRGIRLHAIYFEAIPHTSIEARNKVIELTKKLAYYTDSIKLHIIPFTEIQEAIYQNCDKEYVITIMRRMMYRITEKMAYRNKCLAIINGESVGQVASQTLTSMHVINEVTNYPVIRPVACLDKLEIIDISKKIDTYDISILPFEDCCTVFVPKHPVINPSLEQAKQMEDTIFYQEMIERAIQNSRTITITEDYEENKEFSELL